MRRPFPGLIILLVTLPLFAADDKPRTAGPTETGFLLPNGWHLTPAGRQVTLTDLPLNIVPLKDGKYALTASSGFNRHELALVDLLEACVVTKETVRQSWFGLALDADEQRIWWAGGGANVVHTFDRKEQQIRRTGPAEPDQSKAPREEKARRRNFKSGLRLDPNNERLYTLDIDQGQLDIVAVKSGEVTNSVSLGGRPYDVIEARNGLLYVSD